MEFFKNLGGGKISEEQLKSFRVRDMVFQELANRKLLLQEARHRNMLAADNEVMEKIQEIPTFQKDGKFDVPTYKQVLDSNHYTPGGFEKLVREDLSVQRWENYFKDRVHVADGEVEREFKLKQDKRSIKYVVLTPEAAQKVINIEASKVAEFLADPTQMNLVKMKFAESKYPEGQKLEDVQDKIARGIIASQQVDEIQKVNEKLAEQLLPLLGSSNDAKANALLKPLGLEVKSSGLFSRKSGAPAEIRDAKEMLAEAFGDTSTIDLKAGGKSKKYLWVGRILLAAVVDSKKAGTLSSIEHDALMEEMLGRKTHGLFSAWMQTLTAKAQIDINASVVNSD